MILVMKNYSANALNGTTLLPEIFPLTDSSLKRTCGGIIDINKNVALAIFIGIAVVLCYVLFCLLVYARKKNILWDFGCRGKHSTQKPLGDKITSFS